MERFLEALLFMMCGAAVLFAIYTILGRNGGHIAKRYRVSAEESQRFDWKKASITNGCADLGLVLIVVIQQFLHTGWIPFLLVIYLVAVLILDRKSRYLRPAEWGQAK